MRNLHYKGIFSLDGELIQTHYNPHEFDKTTIIVAYQILTHIEEHRLPEVKNIAYQVMGSYRPRGDRQGYAKIKLVKRAQINEVNKQSKLKVELSGNPLFWYGCREIAAKVEFNARAKLSNSSAAKPETTQMDFVDFVNQQLIEEE